KGQTGVLVRVQVDEAVERRLDGADHRALDAGRGERAPVRRRGRVVNQRAGHDVGRGGAGGAVGDEAEPAVVQVVVDQVLDVLERAHRAGGVAEAVGLGGDVPRGELGAGPGVLAVAVQVADGLGDDRRVGGRGGRGAGADPGGGVAKEGVTARADAKPGEV